MLKKSQGITSNKLQGNKYIYLVLLVYYFVFVRNSIWLKIDSMLKLHSIFLKLRTVLNIIKRHKLQSEIQN